MFIHIGALKSLHLTSTRHTNKEWEAFFPGSAFNVDSSAFGPGSFTAACTGQIREIAFIADVDDHSTSRSPTKDNMDRSSLKAVRSHLTSSFK